MRLTYASHNDAQAEIKPPINQSFQRILFTYSIDLPKIFGQNCGSMAYQVTVVSSVVKKEPNYSTFSGLGFLALGTIFVQWLNQ